MRFMRPEPASQSPGAVYTDLRQPHMKLGANGCENVLPTAALAGDFVFVHGEILRLSSKKTRSIAS